VDEFLQARRKQRLITLGVVVLVGAGVAFFFWKLPGNAHNVDRLPQDTDVVAVIDLTELREHALFKDQWQLAKNSERFASWKAVGIDPETLTTITFGLRAIDGERQWIVMYSGDIDTSGVEAKLASVAEELGRSTETIAGITFYQRGWGDEVTYAGLIDEETVAIGTSTMLRDVIEEETSITDHEELWPLVRSAAASTPAWGAAYYDEPLDKWASAKSHSMPPLDWVGVGVTMGWLWTDEQHVRYELRFADGKIADKAGGRLIASGSYGGVEVLFPMIATRPDGKVNIRDDKVPVRIDWVEELPLRWRFLEL